MLIQKLSALLLYLVVALPVAAWVWRSGRARLRFALLLVLLPLLFTGRALLTGQVYAPSDLAFAHQPFAAASERLGVGDLPPPILHDLYTMIIPGQRAVRHAWSKGEWPLWNPFILCGQSIPGAGQAAPFYPLHLLGLFLSLPMSLGFSAALHLFLAALGAFLLARDLGCESLSGLVAATGWMAATGTIFWIHWPLGMTMLLLPLVILGVRGMVREPGLRSCLLLSAVFSLGLLGGHPETSVHHFWVGLAWALWELASFRWREWPRRVIWAGVAGALTVGTTAVFVFPVVDGLLQSFEWALRGHDGLASALPWRHASKRLLGSFFPFVQASTPSYPWLSSSIFGAYCGSVLMAPAAYGLWRSPARERWPLAILGTVGLAAGAKVPGLYPVLDFLPLLDRTINERLIALSALSIVLLAALGLQEMQKQIRAGSGVSSMRKVALLIGFALATGSAFFAGALQAHGFPFEALRGHILLFLVPPALWLLCLSTRRWHRHALAILLALLAVQRVGEIGGYHPVVPAERFYPEIRPLHEPALTEGIYRAIGVGGMLLPNQGAHYGLEDVRGYDAVHHARFRHLSQLWTTDPPLWFGRIVDLDNPLLSLVNVRWAFLKRAQRPGPGWRLARRGEGAHLWENLQVVERAFLPERVRLVEGPGKVRAGLATLRDPTAVAWIEPPGGAKLPVGEQANGSGEVVLRRAGLGYRLDARLDSSAWVVVTDVAWRGWRARSGGRELLLGYANLAFLTLELPAGEHEVELFFRPRSFEVGLMVTGITLLGLLSLWLGSKIRSGREQV